MQVQKVLVEAGAVGAGLAACVVVVARGVDKLWAATAAAFEEHKVVAMAAAQGQVVAAGAFEDQEVMAAAASEGQEVMTATFEEQVMVAMAAC